MVCDESQLAYLAKMVNEGETYKDTYFTLVGDIDLSNYECNIKGNNYVGAIAGKNQGTITDEIIEDDVIIETRKE